MSERITFYMDLDEEESEIINNLSEHDKKAFNERLSDAVQDVLDFEIIKAIRNEKDYNETLMSWEEFSAEIEKEINKRKSDK